MKFSRPLIFSLLLISACGGEKTNSEAPIRPVKYVTVQMGGVSDQVSFTGVTKSGQEAKLAFKVGGVINEVLVKDGQKVWKGQLIASLDPEDYSLQVEQANVSIKQAQTSLNVARSTYKRVERLYENNSVSLSEFEQAKGNYEAAEAQLEAAKKQEQAAKNQLGYTRLQAPFNGIVSGLNIESGEIIGGGNPIGTLSTEGESEVEVGVADNYIGKFEEGDEVLITLSALPEQTFKGHISEIAFNLQRTTTYPVRVRINDPDMRIRPGMSAEVFFNPGNKQSSNTQIIVIPAKAVNEDPEGQRFVFQLEGQGDTLTVKQTYIELGELLSTGFEVNSGLNPGDKIATAGLSSLMEGMEVRLLK